MTDTGGFGRKQPGLRFDKVALRLIQHLQTSLRDHVPEEKTLFVTVTAPIRTPAKTGDETVEQIRDWLSRSSSSHVDFRSTINDNQIRGRLGIGSSDRSQNVLVFVHNPETDTAALLNAAQSSLSD